MGNGNPPDENISARLPNSDAEVELLKPAIAELLPTIPTTWADHDLDTLTDAQQRALFLLVAAGMVEQRIRFRQRMLNRPFVVEATIVGPAGRPN